MSCTRLLQYETVEKYSNRHCEDGSLKNSGQVPQSYQKSFINECIVRLPRFARNDKIILLQSQYSKKSDHGFTLMELVVSIAVFSILVLAAVDVMISVFKAQAKAIALKDVFDNVRFSLELMSRELRTGSNMAYTAVPPPNCPRVGLQFTSYNQGSPQERFYYWEDTDGDSVRDALMRVVMPTAGSVDCSIVIPQQFTSEEVIVDKWTVGLLGNTVGPADGQPRITLGFTMHSRDPRFGQDTIVKLQTTVTQRLRDL